MEPIGVRVLDNLVTHCEEIVEYLNEQDSWVRSRVGADNAEDDMRTSESFFFPMLSFNNPIMLHEMNQVVWNALDEYARDHEFVFNGVEDVSVQRYQVGDHYDSHIDAGPTMPRIVSALVYLNTVTSGGETRFTLFDYAVKPVAGRVVIFPSNYIYRHEALPPKKGIKIAAAYWARG